MFWHVVHKWKHAYNLGSWMLELYFLATAKVLSGSLLVTMHILSSWLPICDSAHSWWLYRAAPLGAHAARTMTWYPTEPTIPCSQTFIQVCFFPNLFLERHNLVCITVISQILFDIVVHVNIMFWMCLWFPCCMSDINILLNCIRSTQTMIGTWILLLFGMFCCC